MPVKVTVMVRNLKIGGKPSYPKGKGDETPIRLRGDVKYTHFAGLGVGVTPTVMEVSHRKRSERGAV